MNTPAPDLNFLLHKFKEYNPNQNTSLIEKAYHFAEKAHEGQKRESGEPFFTHCCHVASILMDFNLDADTICAGLLHDTVEDTPVTLEQVQKEFSKMELISAGAMLNIGKQLSDFGLKIGKKFLFATHR